jgi:hypothetical protein
MVERASDGIEVAVIVEAAKDCGLWTQVYPAVKERNDKAIEEILSASAASEIDVVLDSAQDEHGILPRQIWIQARERVCELAGDVRAPAQLSELSSLADLAKRRGMWRRASEFVRDADALINSLIEFDINNGLLVLSYGSEKVMPDNTGHARRLYESGYTEVRDG